MSEQPAVIVDRCRVVGVFVVSTPPMTTDIEFAMLMCSSLGPI